MSPAIHIELDAPGTVALSVAQAAVQADFAALCFTIRDTGIGMDIAQAAEAPALSLAGLHILIAEDMELNAEILSDLLEMEGSSSEWAENGQRAVEMYEPGRFSAILMDMRMPVMDGLTATREIRKLDAAIPIIALTANAFEEDVRQCLQAGMNAHLSKPVDIDQLKTQLESLLAQP